MKRNFVLIISLFIFLNSVTAGNVVDSLRNVLKSLPDDTSRVNTLNRLANALSGNSPEEALKLSKKSLELSETLHYKKGEGFALNNIGIVHQKRGDYEKALDYYLKSLKIREEISDKKGTAATMNNIGNVFFFQNKWDKALEYYGQALSANKTLGNKRSEASNMSNIANIYMSKKQYVVALDIFQEAIKIREEIGDKEGIARTLNSVGELYYEQKNYTKTLEVTKNALSAAREVNDKFSVAEALLRIGKLPAPYVSSADALKNLNEGLAISKEIEASDLRLIAYENMTRYYAFNAKYKDAYASHLLVSGLKDSILNEEKARQMSEMSAKYESDKQEKEIELLTKDKQLQDTKINKQKLIIISGTIGFVLILVLVFLIYIGYRQKQKANFALEEKNILIETKNRDITDSINYAKRIQDSIIPSEDGLKKYFPESFVFFKPKDIVSGDFYFFDSVKFHDGDCIYVAASDCTGHGVPGSLMSMLGINFLGQNIRESKTFGTASILDGLHKNVISTLQKESNLTETKDGMDIALLGFHTGKNEIHFSGALRPLYYFVKGELKIIPGDRFSIGGDIEGRKKLFSSTTIPCEKGNTFYLFSDGFSDQFGGENGKKFMTKNLQRLLTDVQSKSMEKQKQIIEETFNNWKKTLAQVDDVLVIGIRI